MALKLKMKLGCTTTYAVEEGGKNTHYRLHAVMGEGNLPWAKWTPNGQLEFTVTNPDAEDLVNGREYLVTLEPAP